MKEDVATLLKRIKDGDLATEVWKVQVSGLPGLTWFNRSGFKKAEKELKKALAQANKKGGANHPAAALMSYFLGDLYMRHGRPASAETHLLRAMEIWADTDTDNFRAIIHKLLDLVADYGQAGNVSDSERLGGTIVDSVKKHLTPGDSLIVSALSDLAVVFQIQGRISEAAGLFDEALTQSEQNAETLSRFGPRILMNLAGLSTLLLDFPQAERHLNRAQEIAETSQPTDQGHVFEIMCNKAKVCAALGKEEELEAATAEAQIFYEIIWESEPELVIPRMFDLVRLHERRGNDDTAEKIFWRLMDDIAAVMDAGDKENSRAIINIWVEDIARKGPTKIIRENLDTETADLLDHNKEFREHITSLVSGRKGARRNRDQAETRRRT